MPRDFAPHPDKHAAVVASSSMRAEPANDARQGQALGRRLRALRHNAGMTLREVGETVGVTTAQVSKYERGDCAVPEQRLPALAETLGVSLSALGDGAAAEAASRQDTNSFTLEAASLLSRISPPSRRMALVQLMHALAEQSETQAMAAISAVAAPRRTADVEPDEARLVSMLREAILQPNTGLSLRYQPIVAAADGQLTGFEALLRWTTPDGVAIAPDRAFRLAAAHELEEALEFWVLQEAIMQSASWMKAQPGLTLSINVAGALLANTLGTGMVRALLRTTGVPAERLCIEVVETTLLDAASRSSLRALKDLGLKLAIDDFGTGQSSLARLLDLDVDVVKLDRSFFMGRSTTHAGHLEFLQAVVSMAHARRAIVVAEGIAEPADAAMARRAGCDSLQGFWFAQPLSAQATQEIAVAREKPWAVGEATQDPVL